MYSKQLHWKTIACSDLCNRSRLAFDRTNIFLLRITAMQSSKYLKHYYADYWTRRLLAIAQNIPVTDVILSKTSFGKPYAVNSDFRFNISCCHDALLIGLSKNDIGIDIIYEKRKINDIQHFYRLISSDIEQFECHKIDKKSLLKIWVGKESLLKLIGSGFYIHPSALSVLPMLRAEKNAITVGRKRYHLMWLPKWENFVSCIAMHDPPVPSLWKLSIFHSKQQ